METTGNIIAAKGGLGEADGYFQTIANLFLSPGRAFASLAARPRWLLPFIMCSLLAITFEAATAKYRMADLRESIRQDASLSQDEIERRTGNIDAQRTSSISLRQVAFGTVLLTVLQGIKLFGMAFVIWLSLQFYPRNTGFMKVVSICSFVFLIAAFEQTLRIPLIIAKGSCRIFLGPAVFLPYEWSGSPLFNLFERLDIFSLWIVVLLGIALVKVAGLSRAKAIMTTGYLYVLWLLEGLLFGNLVQVG